MLTAASVPFSLAHVGIMVGLRAMAMPLLFDTGYTFFVDPPTDLLYEYRKDLFAYAVIIGLLTLSRQIELGNQEAAEARKEAQESGRLTLKSGGRTIVKGSRRYRDRLAPPQDAPPHTDA
ncbi:hypothetical protein ABT336_02455 [Micromonospora sp. NPDC000207]|uniref:hypothetical protein n=1 Tax=Micromonospora sp. NPDC000207 TaxID=3154246 RepID=UPI00331C5EC7